MAFHLTQGTFSYLPPLTDEQITRQIEYAMANNWAVSVEFTDDPHPRNDLWEMWGLPMFDQKDASAVMYEVNECRRAYPNHYVRVNAYDSSYGRQTMALSFIVNRPANDPGFVWIGSSVKITVLITPYTVMPQSVLKGTVSTIR